MVSIIVPVYNSAEYLSRCVESILNQSYADLELLLVDDCSTDKSFEVMLEYAKKDSRVKCFKTEKNSGPSVARNMGLDNAKGQWIAFVDSDDWIEEKFIQKLYEAAESFKADIAICGMLNQYRDHNVKELSFGNKECCFEEGTIDNLKKIALGGETETGNSGIEITGPVCKLYKMEIINDLRFPEGVDICEDTCFVFKAYELSNRVFYMGECLYYRNVRDASLSYKTDFRYCERRAKYVNYMLEHLDENRYDSMTVNRFIYFNLKEVVHYYTTRFDNDYRKYINQFIDMIGRPIDFKIIQDNIVVKWAIKKHWYGMYRFMYKLYTGIKN